MRDDFPEKAKDTLAKRVGTHCSNPQCWKLTSGPRDDPAKSVNIGVAAHITAAAIGGPRFDSSLSARQRSAITNAIWLCQNCAKLIDNDAARYTVDLLRQWKTLAEETARLGVESTGAAIALQPVSDDEMVKAYAQCFDRPAFQDHFRQEGSMEAFDKAIEDTIVGINTGSIRSRDGHALLQTRGKAFLKNRQIRERMDVIVDLLRWIRFRYTDAVKRKAITFHGVSGGTTSYCINEQELARWMDDTRQQVLELFSEVCHQVGIHPPSLRPGHRRAFPSAPVAVSPNPRVVANNLINPQSAAEAFQTRVSRLSHELRGPLVAIRGAADLMKKTDDPKKMHDLAKEIGSWCMLLERMTEPCGFLGTSERDYHFQRSLLLRDIITPALESAEMLLRERQFERSQIHLTDFSAGPPLWLDRGCFQQVVFNLLSNAVKYAQPGTPFRVVIRTSRSESEHQISICDWGIGVDEDEKVSLFLPGFRGRKPQTMDVHGDGLGLTVAKSVVEAHGGRIAFRSFHSPTEVVIILPRSLEITRPTRKQT